MTAVTVLRFGSSLLGSADGVAAAVHEIYRDYRAGRAVVAMVAAPGGSDEGAAAARLVRALDRAGVPAALLAPRRARSGSGALARTAGPSEADADRVLRQLRYERVLVVPGSVGVEGVYAGAVGGVYGLEPAARPLRVALLGLGTVGGGVYRHLLADPGRFSLTGIAVREPDRHIRAGVPAALLTRDAWRLLEQPCDLVIEVIGGVEPATRLIAAALARGCDVVTANKQVVADEGTRLQRHAAAHGVCLLYSAAAGGAVPVLEAAERAARSGLPIRAIRGVLNGTANFVLDRLAAGSEHAGRGADGAPGAGQELAAAVRAAQELGYAEADPTRDLDGRDAACKLRLLARAAFGVELAEGDVARRGLETVTPAMLAAARRRGQVVRLVAECWWRGNRVAAAVRPVALPARDFLAGARDEENRLVIERRGAEPLRLAGRGAGRWPTAEAVLADVMDLARSRWERHAAAIGLAVRVPAAEETPTATAETAAAATAVIEVEPAWLECARYGDEVAR